MTRSRSHSATDSRDRSPLRVVLAGYGTVGRAVDHQLIAEMHSLAARVGRPLQVVCILVRNVDQAIARASDARAHSPSLPQPEVVNTVEDAMASRPDIVCEALGDVDVARSLALAALAAGVPYVTANKQLVARNWPELMDASSSNGASLMFEASAGGAMPVVRTLKDAVAGSRVTEVIGILNGTTNYVLSSMESTGLSYDEALAQAGALGYAEPDPTEDVSGLDTAAKIAILASLAFGGAVHPDDVARTGITGISDADISAAARYACRIRLLGRAVRHADGTPSCEVSPYLVPDSHPLAAVTGATNAVTIIGSPFRRIVLQGPGAGGPETASAMVADMVDALNAVPADHAHDGTQAGRETLAAGPRDERATYIRVIVDDRPGVLAEIAGSLAERSVSIARLFQERIDGPGRAQLVMLTHPADPHSVREAITASGHTDAVLIPVLSD